MLRKYIELIVSHKLINYYFELFFRGMVITNYAKCNIRSSDRVYIISS